MRIEAMTCCGMSVRDFAQAHRISAHSRKRWRDMLDAGEVQSEWRLLLHPSALPKISAGAGSAANETPAEKSLTAVRTDDPPRGGYANRRGFTDDEKHAIVTESQQSGVSVAAVARHHGIVTSMIFRWRVKFGFGKEKPARLASARVADERSGRTCATEPDTRPPQDLLPMPSGMATVELPDGRLVFAPAKANPDAVRRHAAGRDAAPL